MIVESRTNDRRSDPFTHIAAFLSKNCGKGREGIFVRATERKFELHLIITASTLPVIRSVESFW